MLAAQSPLSSHQLIHKPKSNRKPLQPKNQPATPIAANSAPVKPKPISQWTAEVSPMDNYSGCNKENIPPNTTHSTPVVKTDPFPVESFGASLAEELSAIREKMERLRTDSEKTETMLRERAKILDLQMKEILDRGEVQKHFEIEVDRLYRLREIRLACMTVTPLRSLRDKEQEKKMKLDQLKANNKTMEENDEHKDDDESTSQSQCSRVVTDTIH